MKSITIHATPDTNLGSLVERAQNHRYSAQTGLRLNPFTPEDAKRILFNLATFQPDPAVRALFDGLYRSLP